MGQGSKKKKKKNKGRAASKDHSSHSADYSDLISEEFTALPYSKDTGYENLDVSALLLVRCLSGYPSKCPKLQINPEKGLSKSHVDNLLSLLYDQANSNAREGRVMIFNLVEAAQEFLSDIVPLNHQLDNVPLARDSNESSKDTARLANKSCPSKEVLVYGFVDLFIGCGESWQWSFGRDSCSEISSLAHFHTVPLSKQIYEGVEKNFNQKGKALKEMDKRGSLFSASAKLETLEEDSVDESNNLANSDSSRVSEDFVQVGAVDEKDACADDHEDGSIHDDYDDQASDSMWSLSSTSIGNGQASHAAKRDLIMAHLLRLACGAKGPLADALPEIASELQSLGILSEFVRDLATQPSALYSKTFDRVFRSHMGTSRISQFWEPVSDFRAQNASSRYLNDFEELQSLGHGGFGHVVLCKNKLDGRQYAVKKILLKDKSPPLNDRILREVATLSRLQHQHVVRYYQAWFETGEAGSLEGTILGSRTVVSSSFSWKDKSLSDVANDSKLESTYLYIQMEYCPRTLRQLFESYNHFDEDLAWYLFRQIVEGLAHIHGQGIIHRDLTPNNIFFDSRNHIKIGDFGLAKFLKLEQLDQDPAFPSDIQGVSIDGTGQIGTYFYTAPEIEHGWPKIDEKADMYSLGVVFFELWHPFGTAMERHIVLSELQQKGEIPPSWIAEFPEQAALLRRLMSPSPSERPSATELLQRAFPPRMEYELLDKFLRTMQTSEDTSVYDKVVSAIFDEEMLSSKYSSHSTGRLKLVGDDSSFAQYSDVDTEVRDHVIDVTKEVFKRHCARHLEMIPMHLLGDAPELDRHTVKLLSHGGHMIQLSRELRSTFVRWVVVNQKLSFKRYGVSYVYRRAIGRSPPNRYLQGDFDIIGGASALVEAEVIKVTMDILVHFFNSSSCDIHLNHGQLLNAIWSWTGTKDEHRQKVAELLSLLGGLHPQSSERKSKWVVIRRQLSQELGLVEAVVNRLQTVSSRFCGDVGQALPRLRGALPADKSTRKALDELSSLVSYLRVWKIEKNIFIDALMPPTESYHRDIFFQIYLRKESFGSPINGTLLAAGGRYDYILHQMWELEHKSSPPGAVGTSLALETIIHHSFVDCKPLRCEANVNILVCSKGGGGLLEERMELAAELWESNIKAEFVPSSDPSLTEQYEYANEHDIKCLVIITDSGVSQKDSVKVRHLELKKEKEVERGYLVQFLLKAMATQFRNPLIWN
ncbi:eukaryotic translation initiation factor 2-alpha kinase [Ancistrocladus abbreviatus]